MSGIPQKRRHSLVLRSLLVGIGCLLVGYLLVLMYAQGEYLFALVTLVVSAAGLWIYTNRRAYAWRYVYPGLAGMALFVLFPLACTVAIAFTNYSSTNQLSEARAQQVLLSRQYQAGDAMNFALYSQGDRWQLALSTGENSFLSAPFTLGGEPSGAESVNCPAAGRSRAGDEFAAPVFRHAAAVCAGRTGTAEKSAKRRSLSG